MSTFHAPAKHSHRLAFAPTTRLGRWAGWLTLVAVAGLVMTVFAMAFSPDDPAFSSAWGLYDLLSLTVLVVFALVAPVVALIAIVRHERALSVYLSIGPFLIIFLHPLFIDG
jgi:hypothetical protein